MQASQAITAGDGRRLQVWNLESQTCVQAGSKTAIVIGLPIEPTEQKGADQMCIIHVHSRLKVRIHPNKYVYIYTYFAYKYTRNQSAHHPHIVVAVTS